MIASFSTALSGLNAMSTAIDIVGNNLANLNTTGYKDDVAAFKDLVAESLSGSATSQVGLGTTAPLTERVFSQGTITATQGALNAAINGSGFFVLKNALGQQLYTRDGSFQVDQNGYLTTSSGEFVQGWSEQNNALNTTGLVGNIQIPVGQSLAPQATTTFSLSGNLDASAQSGTSTGTFTQAIPAVDSLGNSASLTVTFTKDPNVASQWNYAVTGPTGSTVTGGTGSIQFNQVGVMTTPTSANGNIPITVSGLTDGAASLNINWNLYNSDNTPKFTGFAEASTISSNTQNGQPAAQLTGVSFGDDGKLVATYSNGVPEQVVAQVAMAGIRNPESMVDAGNNNFTLSGETATPAIGTSGTGGRGVIESKALEGSTVDIASELSSLLIFQRSYQANSRVVTVSDSLAQETVNLVHA